METKIIYCNLNACVVPENSTWEVKTFGGYHRPTEPTAILFSEDTDECSDCRSDYRICRRGCGTTTKYLVCNEETSFKTVSEVDQYYRAIRKVVLEEKFEASIQFNKNYDYDQLRADMRELSLPYPSAMETLAERYNCHEQDLWNVFKGINKNLPVPKG